jgi:hypothetical protein
LSGVRGGGSRHHRSIGVTLDRQFVNEHDTTRRKAKPPRIGAVWLFPFASARGEEDRSLIPKALQHMGRWFSSAKQLPAESPVPAGAKSDTFLEYVLQSAFELNRDRCAQPEGTKCHPFCGLCSTTNRAAPKLK